MSSRIFAASLNKRKLKEQPTPIILSDINVRGIAERSNAQKCRLRSGIEPDLLAYLPAAGVSAAGASAAGAGAAA